VHVVPRWNGDTNFMTVVGNVRVLPEDMAATSAKLRPIFERLQTRQRLTQNSRNTQSKIGSASSRSRGSFL
jgi:diadenosine tetraphosphate (Ap4A) HIT family hydrolase